MYLKKLITISSALILIFAFSLFITQCSDKDKTTEPEEHEQHWSYSGETGPDHWGDLKQEYSACGEGKNQSPIDIKTNNVISSDLPDIQFHYQASTLQVVNNGHSIQANLQVGSYIEVNNSTYDLLQFHFHYLSENTVDGSHYPIEAHFVHQNADGALAVIAVFINDGAENQAYKPFWDHLPAEEEGEYDLHTAVNADDLLPTDKRTYRYSGSLTTPPCSEGVSWFVMATPIEMSTAQINAFKAIYDHNYRPVLPLNARQVLFDTVAN